MDKIILGLLMLKKLTIYELRSIIEMNFTSMCSNSMGSIQAAIKKLLEKKMIVYEEFVENSVNKKFYSLTDAGKACFLEWVEMSMVAGKVKDMELSKLFFMGFVPTQKRLSLIQSYIVDLKKEREQLENIKIQDINVAKLQYITYLEENQEQFNHFLQDTEHSNIQRDIQDIIDFELLTLKFGIDRTNFEIAWFENLKKKLINEWPNNSQNQGKGGS
ncbi:MULTISPECIES: PadR family transcriptional regulator [unclassified Clostridioides]|uniref:PadR family transcriptional regulator n=1 Tax=unclassified Clostridioides TaxID=2635829 RepID=UPI001D104199|nr:PadR family transcriptional regulator [Clostridioides sp. ES-S-0049-03]MCC0677763.1 PadR family transcriptional regulator [Clostridioides sp. ES-W-0018-02]MCC0713106.1 PadR family transcriptional regulator [Clostridioides sp. ES-W-0017-02]